ncbi:rRNA maturation RNase YbeY [Rhodoferax sp.]|uniref:rRNA maturation RNase YbeY n=1 Tax=Rhodoferax sp. TaxID=50421 RepID=UPI0027304407|nr:rRNA maturation RNase YbeY [Rhodoferax sp.]MDP2443316.1 rRNA maturation RNase YbeY [Rhodoferax sp.]
MKQLNKLALTVQFATMPVNLPSRAEFRHWAKAALLHDVEATLRVVDEAEGMQLNQDYRDKPAATNVLTFAYGAEQDDGPLCGDIVLCAAVVEGEAVEQEKTLQAHYAHLTVHGMLHLQGYDHVVENEAIAMEAIESFIMMRLGFPDPYQDG